MWWVQLRLVHHPRWCNPYSLLNWTPIENHMDHPTIWSRENQWSWSRVSGRYRNLSKFISQISSSKTLPISFWNPGKSGRTRRLRKKIVYFIKWDVVIFPLKITFKIFFLLKMGELKQQLLKGKRKMGSLACQMVRWFTKTEFGSKPQFGEKIVGWNLGSMVKR